MKDQEHLLPHTSHSLTVHAHPTAVIQLRSVTCEGAMTWLASKLCLTLSRCQTTLEIISGDRERVALGKLWFLRCLVKLHESQEPNQLKIKD